MQNGTKPNYALPPNRTHPAHPDPRQAEAKQDLRGWWWWWWRQLLLLLSRAQHLDTVSKGHVVPSRSRKWGTSMKAGTLIGVLRSVHSRSPTAALKHELLAAPSNSARLARWIEARQPTANYGMKAFAGEGATANSGRLDD